MTNLKEKEEVVPDLLLSLLVKHIVFPLVTTLFGSYPITVQNIALSTSEITKPQAKNITKISVRLFWPGIVIFKLPIQ